MALLPTPACLSLCFALLWPGVARAHEPAEAPEETSYGAVASVPRAHPEPVSTTHVHQADVAAVPMRSGEDALRLVPGLLVIQHGSEGKGQQFFLRGFDALHGADLELWVEGVPLNEWSNVHAQGYLDAAFVIPELIQTVEAVKGPFELTQGAFAMAGTTRYTLGVAPEHLGARFSYTAGTTGRQRVLASYAPKHSDGSEFVAAEVMHDPSYGERRAARRATATGRVDLMRSVRRGQLSFWAAAYAAKFELPGTIRARDVERGRVGFYDAYHDDGRGTSVRGLGALQYELARAGHQVHATLYGGYRYLTLHDNFTGYAVNAESGDYRHQRHAAFSFGARATWDAPLTPHWSVHSGVGVAGDELAQRERGPTPEAAPVRTRDLLAVQLLSHAQLGLRYHPMRAFALEAGARGDVAYASVRDDLPPSDGEDADSAAAERASQRALFALSPRAVANLRPHPWLRLSAAYGRGFRPPEARALAQARPRYQGLTGEGASLGKAHITRSHAFELGARLRPDPALTLNVTGFATLIARESVYDHGSGALLELNGTRRVGAEVTATVLALPWLSLSADATFVDARFRESGNRVPFAPWLTAGARGVLTHPSGVRAGLRFLGVAPRPLPHGARGEALYLLDATLGYRRGWFDVNLALENLLLRRLREGEYHFASRWFDDEPDALPTTQVVAGPPFNARLTLAVVF